MNPEINQKTAENPPEKGKFDWREELFEWLDLMVPVLALATLLCAFVLMIFAVKGSSMYPTLSQGDVMLIQRIGYTPTAGDVVVLRKEGFPAEGNSEAIVKRVIATAGQEVRIDFDTNTVYVDGVALDEPYINHTTQWPDPATMEVEDHEWLEGDVMELDDAMIYTDLVVPEGCVFVMGDNRNYSTDSRDYRLGPVDERYVIGRACWVLFPFSHFGAVK